MKKFFDFFLSGYKDSPLEIQKKSKVLLTFLLTSYFIAFSIIIFEITTGFPFKTYSPFFVGILFGLIILIFLKLNRYEIASNLFIFMFILTNSTVVIIDPYNIPFELYRFTFSMMFALITACLVAYNRQQIILVVIIGIAGIIMLYFFKFCLTQQNTPIIMITFINCLLLFTLSGIFGWLMITITKQVIKVAEDNAKEAIMERDESERRLNIIEVYTRPSLRHLVANGGDPTKDPPRRKELAVLFCDIRGFTAISEMMEPIEIVKMLNIYFEAMNRIITYNGGEIDKLIGDAIMAAFENADNAVKAAIGMQKKMIDLNNNNVIGKFLNNGIGIHYGSVVVGNIGSEEKKDNTIIGDIVNAASRLESLTKNYYTGIIISDKLKSQLKEEYLIRLLDIVLVKGKRRAEKIYEIYDHEEHDIINWKRKIQNDLEIAFKHYIKGNFTESIRIYEQLLKTTEIYDTSLILFYQKRCLKLQKMKNEGILNNWQGIYEFHTK